MPYTALTGGAYQARSLIAAAQRCVNLYPESMPSAQGEPFPVALNCTPGLTLLSTGPGGAEARIRGMYTASNGDLFVCLDNFVYYVDPQWQWHAMLDIIGSAPADVVPRLTPVSMTDNGTNLLVVDGTLDGYVLTNLQSHSTPVGYRLNATGGGAAGSTAQDGFYGGDRADFSDTFFVLNQPGTPNFYVSGSEAMTFDPLDFAAKSAKADLLLSIIVVHRVLWLFGQYSTEIWYNTGGTAISGGAGVNNFPYEPMPGTFFPRGLAAKYSVAATDNQVMWLSQDLNGRGVVMRGVGYNAQRISTHAMEAEFSTYSRIDDAVGFCYQQQGHTFYMLNFTEADKTWCCDITNPNAAEWHERVWLDDNGHEHRHRANFATFAYNKNLCGDWEDGNLYELDLNNYTDNGRPIKRLRSFPHQIDPEAGRRVQYKKLIANMQVGTSGASTSQQTVISTQFTADDGTFLENFIGTGDVGSTWSRVDLTSEGEIMSDAFIGVGGTTEYLSSGVPLNPDYVINFQAKPTDYTAASPAGTVLYAIGRADPTHAGYKVGVISDGAQYSIELVVMGGATTTVVLGTIATGYYDVIMTMRSHSITVTVQRSEDGKWINPDAVWGGSPTTGIAIVDSTYSLPGRVLIGGNW